MISKNAFCREMSKRVEKALFFAFCLNDSFFDFGGNQILESTQNGEITADLTPYIRMQSFK